jgi:hypothetical protein
MSSLQELEFHLGALSASSNSVRVQVPPSIPTQRLAELLQTCNRAGFTDVGLVVGTR